MNRPEDFDGFVGQIAVRENLGVFVDAAKARGEALDHVLFHGPPGLGKTTLARIAAFRMGASLRTTTAPVIQKPGDLVASLVSLDDGDALFIDEIHRLPLVVEETLYSAMEDYRIDILVGEGPSAKPVSVELPRFTLIGATTRIGAISKPLMDRFGIVLRMDFYSTEELAEIVRRNAAKMSLSMGSEACAAVARRARGTPRVAGRLLRRVRDFAEAGGMSAPGADLVDEALERMGIDPIGLTQTDLRYLDVLASHYGGGPAGLETLAVALSEPRDTVEDVIEPFLIRCGLIGRGPRGRSLTEAGWAHLGRDMPQAA